MRVAEIKVEKYIAALRSTPTSSSTTSASFTPAEVTTLIRAGFLTSTTSQGELSTESSASKHSGNGTFVTTAGARWASGTAAAVGGSNAIHDAGGRMVISSLSSDSPASQTYNFSLPSVGSYLQLLSNAREHLLALLSKSQFGEAPVDLLRERWEGGVALNEKPVARVKGLAAPVLPGKTRKWKQFYGLRFWHVLGECLGTGAVEAFETGTVGLGVRVAG